MRVIVFGAGAIGSIFGARLAAAGHDLLLVGGPAHVAAIRERGLRVEGIRPGVWRLPAVEELPGAVATDAVLLTVKGYDVEAATRTLATRLSGTVPVLLPQNGLGIEARFAEGLARTTASSQLLGVRAVNTIPATFVAPGVVRQAGHGELRLATPASVPPEIARGGMLFHDLFVEGGIAVSYVPDLDRALWTKAVINGAINPVTAANGVLNGALDHAPYREIAERLLAEGVAAARAGGHPLDRGQVTAEFEHTIRATAQNRSSMLQDLDRGRRTEIGTISGALWDAGHAHGVPMPITEEYIARIRAREPPAGKSS